ncbi:MAG TPA: RHS repeat-associated core domain-containing protein, partial [Nitrospira sp.]|nr:RHS repeat-associated core domain-containing protein [Nitrospira sp.]
LGSTRILTDPTGKASASFTYTAYGDLAGKAGTATTPLGYAGQFTDADTGLQYLRARFYDPDTAQFLTRDPVTALTRAPYEYASDNPVRYTDPSGMVCLERGSFGLPVINTGDCVAEAPGAAADVIKSPAAAPVVTVACLYFKCSIAKAIAAGVLTSTTSDYLRAQEEECVDLQSILLENFLTELASAGPGGLLKLLGSRVDDAMGLTPAGEQLLELALDVPGLAAEVLEALAGNNE